MKSSDTISEYSTSSTISAAMEQRIQNELTRVEQAHGVKVLYACESGSRGWGFASQDSDYDVRFIYAHPADWYLAVCPEKQRDVLESGIVSTPDGVLDCSGWDVRKALRLLQKFNGALPEWLTSPIVYRKQGSFADRALSAATQGFSPLTLWHHYRSIRNKSLERFQTKQTAKVWLYAFRPMLAMLWIERGLGIPPTPFEILVRELLSPQEQAETTVLVAHKRSGKENDHDFVPPPILAAFLDRQLAPESEDCVDIPAARAMPNMDAVFRLLLRETFI